MVVAVVAAGLGIFTHATGAFHRTELQTIDARYHVRGSDPSFVKDFVVVGVDSSTLSYFASNTAVKKGYAANFPFPRRDDARVIDNLVKAGAKHIAMDMQFSQPTDNRDDYALLGAVAKAGHVVLATTAVGAHGSTNILGGNAILRKYGGDSVAANATEFPDTDGVYRQMRFSFQGLETFGTQIAAHTMGKKVSPELFGGATTQVPIDYAGPEGTVHFISYWKVYAGKFPASIVRGKTVIVGETAQIGNDVHPTPTSGSTGSQLMAGSEIVANEAATVLHGIPLRDGAGWVNVLLIILLGSAAPLLGLRGWALRALGGGLLVGGLYAVAAQFAFNSGRIIVVIDPEFALAVGVIGTLAVVYLGEAFERQYARSTFARFVPPGVVDEVLASSDEDLRLAAVERVCTVMFSDLRG
ncbi:MAG: CHASE2 domain-containing protein, partial [Acidobacteriota bacterium]|nr:CHASE2 domain-containing protein [Acidobacteriota bacterium]